MIEDSPISSADAFINFKCSYQGSDTFQSNSQFFGAAASAQRVLQNIKLAFWHFDISTFRALYKSFVRPHTEYCSVVWCPFYVKDINFSERAQLRFTRFFT